MSKKFLLLASILLTIIVGTVLFWFYCCECGDKSRNIETVAADKSLVPDEQIEKAIIAIVPDSSASTDWLAVRNQLNKNPLTPYFEPYQTKRTLGQEDLSVLDEIINYLKNNPQGSLTVIGHADISGPRALNMKLSQERADFVKGFMVQKGVNTDKIVSSSKGPDEPAHDNGTPEGRAKNRRAVVLIK